ncbi:MAG: peptidyl-tRNA hydrolase [Candidatus Aenigmarchaeota archaeon]|nr:peptidyl-tRNA hydrolase [Candidatus Aenigmarchaeota archaeon]
MIVMYKQVIVIRSGLKMSKGKTAVQACHACIGAAEKTSRIILSAWRREGQKKVVVEASLEAMHRLKEKADKLKIKSYMVADAGLTELAPGTITAIAIGPDKEEKINKVTGSLPLVR